MTATAAARRSSVAHRAAEGTVAAYLWDESSHAARARPLTSRVVPVRQEVATASLRSRHVAGSRIRMPDNVDQAPDPDSEEFLEKQNTVEKLSPDTTADDVATDADLVSTDPKLVDKD